MGFAFWSIILIFLAVCAIELELLTPAMGGFIVAALVLAGVSVYCGFVQGEAFGFVMLAANLVLLPVALWCGVHFLKRSPLMLHREQQAGVQSAPDALPLAHLCGQQGQSITPLRPAGAAMIGQLRIDVVTEGKFVEAGTPVKVIHVAGSRVVVEPV